MTALDQSLKKWLDVLKLALGSTQVRVIQDLDTVLTFAMSIQAEVGASIQDIGQVKDVSRKPGASAQAADVPMAHNTV
eukprot:3333291-Amphidinium_carterae.1